MTTLLNRSARKLYTPLCVDLDGTLVLTDLLVESLLGLLKHNPLYVFVIPFWLLKGKANLKRQIATRVTLDVTRLPDFEPLLEHIRRHKAMGGEVVLATASDRKYAEAVANHLGLFDRVFCTDQGVNLAGSAKADMLRDAFGDKGFTYAGDSHADLRVWPHAADAILVNPARGVKAAAAGRVVISQVFDEGPRKLKDYVRALRPHQWAKNLLLFVPLAASHQFLDVTLLVQSVLAFAAFSMCASSAYVLNDLLDLSADRGHQKKRRRPFASGRVPVAHGMLLFPVLLIGAATLTAFLPPAFALLLTLYWVITVAYSVRLKQVVLLDVVTLACLYTLRVQAGAAAVQVEPSFWLLGLSLFLFMSLALLKRYSELQGKEASGTVNVSGRGYAVVDIDMLGQMGVTSGYMAVVVLTLYVNSDQVRLLYERPQLIWLLCPIALYWISRIWLMGRRRQVNEDPVVFALLDRKTHVLGAIAMAVLWAAA